MVERVGGWRGVDLVLLPGSDLMCRATFDFGTNLNTGPCILVASSAVIVIVCATAIQQIPAYSHSLPTAYGNRKTKNTEKRATKKTGTGPHPTNQPPTQLNQPVQRERSQRKRTPNYAYPCAIEVILRLHYSSSSPTPSVSRQSSAHVLYCRS